MTNFTLADSRRIALSSIGALLLSATCVAGAVAPAHAAPATANAPLTVADWQEAVGEQLDAKLRIPTGALTKRDHLMARVDVSFDRDGGFTGARVSQTSGDEAVDRDVVRIAQQIAYPSLPAGYRGRPQTVTLQAYFGQAHSQQEAARQQDVVNALASGARPKHDAVQTAALPSG